VTGLEFSLDSAARVALAVLLLWAAAGKARAPGAALAGFARVGVPRGAARPLLALLVGAEAALGALLLTGVALRPAAVAAGALGLLFAAVLVRARTRGVDRLSCGCFGTSGEGRTDALAGRALLLPLLAAPVAFGVPAPSLEAALVAAVAVLALVVAALAALVIALYRQVGLLSLRIAPQGPLELADEGPALGADAPPLPPLARRGAELVLFSSPDCRLCRALVPAAHALTREGVPVHVVDEPGEPETFRRWNVPGTPFAVHLVDGRVAAKGLVNTLEQLETLLELGRSRIGHAA
jgi:hypothetical protein